MKKRLVKVLTVVLSTTLVLSMTVFMSGCGSDETTLAEEWDTDMEAAKEAILADVSDDTSSDEQDSESEELPSAEGLIENKEVYDDEDADDISYDDVEWIQYGEGESTFYFVATVSDEDVRYYEISTDADTVGAALLENNLIAGEDSEYGLYVKEVDGVTADYDVDGTYWAFYIDGEYAMTGVDSTPVESGSTYEFAIEK